MALSLTLDEAREILEFSLAAYSEIRRAFYRNMYDAIFKFLSGTASIADLQRLVEDDIDIGYNETGLVAWQDSGAELPFTEKANAWLKSIKAAQMGFASTMMVNLVHMQGEPDVEPSNEAERRASGYSAYLDAVYANMKCLGAANTMLTFGGVDGLESCHDCRHYKGKRHRASWWVAHDAVPPNRDFECHGYQCQHLLMDDEGKLFTI